MANFIPKIITQVSSCGLQLKQARLDKDLTTKIISQELQIKEEYLIALEENSFEKLPAGLYGKNFIKQYANYLGLNSERIAKDWYEQISNNSADNPFSRKIIAQHKFIIFPKLLKNLLIILAVTICFLYLIFYFKKIILPPQLLIIYPETNLSLDVNRITILGQTENEAEVRINGEIVLNNTNGNFEQNINLKKGLNNIIIKAKKKYSREQIISRQILVE